MQSRSGDPRTAPDRHAMLAAHPLFGALDLDAIERLACYARFKSVPAGTIVFQRGDPGESIFAVCSGIVKISNRSADGRDAVLNLIHPGDIFGEIALLDGEPRTADAQAVTDCELMVIERRDFVPLVARQPGLALKLIAMLCARIRRTSEQVEDVMFLPLPGRLAKTLLWLAGNSASRERISITQREIGQIIGMTRESTNKQLRAFEERNWIRLERGGIVILDSEPLAALAAEHEPAEV